MPKNHCFRGKEEYFCCSAQDASIVASCAGESEAIAFDFKTYRRGAEGAEMTQRKSNAYPFLFFSAFPLRPLRLREAWPWATAVGVEV
jgi:hypothetical protein